MMGVIPTLDGTVQLRTLFLFVSAALLIFVSLQKYQEKSSHSLHASEVIPASSTTVDGVDRDTGVAVETGKTNMRTGSDGLFQYLHDQPFLFSPAFPLPFDLKTGKLSINTKRFKRVRLDVGLAWNAPNSQYWFSKDSGNNLLVFGFEPNPFSLSKIIAGKHTESEYRSYKILESKRVFDSWFPVNAALSNDGPKVSKFYISVGDGGSSSLYPVNPASGLQVEREISVVAFPLKKFLDVFPFEHIPFIELLKIDAQGHDLRILQGVGEEYLKDRIACVAPEADGTSAQYIGDTHSADDIEKYLGKLGFSVINRAHFIFKNRKFSSFPDSECFIEGL